MKLKTIDYVLIALGVLLLIAGGWYVFERKKKATATRNKIKQSNSSGLIPFASEASDLGFGNKNQSGGNQDQNGGPPTAEDEEQAREERQQALCERAARKAANPTMRGDVAQWGNLVQAGKCDPALLP